MEDLEAAGRLVLLDETPVAVTEQTNGLADWLVNEAEQALGDGYPSLCMVAEIHVLDSGRVVLGDFLEGLTRLDRELFSRHPVFSLFLYDRWNKKAFFL